MLTWQEWNALCTKEVPGKKRRQAVSKYARQYLLALTPGITISTNELGEALYPREVGERNVTNDNARTEIFRQLGLLAKDGLDDCCIKGEVCGQFMGRPRRPWLWFCPEDQELCAACGQVVVADEI
jgi:hypothetical protein